MTASLVDMSGVVAAVLQSYLAVVDKCGQAVTGDPAALRSQAQNHTDQAAQLASVVSEISTCVRELAPSWHGSAHTAFQNSVSGLTKDISTVEAELKTEAERLTLAAAAVSTSMSTMEGIRSQFLQYARVLIDEARTASAGSAGAFIDAARQLGESAVSAANTTKERLAAALRELFGLHEETPEGPGSVKVDFEQLKRGPLSWIGEEVLDGRRRTRSVPSWFHNSGWYKLTGDGFAGTRAPRKDDTPFGDEELHAPKLHKDVNVTLWRLPEQDMVLSDHSWGGKIGDANGNLHGYLGPRVTDEAAIEIHNRQLRVDGQLRGTLLDVGASGALTDGPATARGDVGAMVGGQLTGHFDAGLHGVAAHVDAFVGGKVSAAAAVDVAGIGVGAKGELEAGIGAQFDGQATVDGGHVKVNFKIGAALGVGGSLGANIDVDVPKVIETTEHYGHSVIESVESSAAAAARAIGDAW